MEEIREEWLDGQTIEIPVEKYVELRIKIMDTESRYADTLSRLWKLETAKAEVEKNLADAKKQIRELLGMEGESSDDANS